MKVQLHLAKLITLWLIPNCLAMASQPEPEFQIGVNHFNAGHYRRAVQHLSIAIKQSPQLAMAHYYLAISLEHLGRVAEAIEEYRKCYALQSTGTLGNYCRQALANCSKEKATEIMASQAASEKFILQNKGNARANDRIRMGEAQANDLQGKSQDEVEYMRHAKYSRSQIEQVQRNYQDQIAQARVLAQQEALQKQEWSKQRGSLLDETLSNLNGQMSEAVATADSSHLSPVGTNLYVRSYATNAASRQEATSRPVELVATPEEMVLDAHSKGGKTVYHIIPAPLMARQDKINLNDENQSSALFPKLKVHGKLLHY